MASKQDYDLVAEVLKSIKPRQDWDAVYYAKLEQWEDAVNELSMAFEGDNTNFKPEQFKAACGN